MVTCVSSSWAADEAQPHVTNMYQLITGENAEGDRSRWDALYKSQKYIFGTEPAQVLQNNLDLLPKGKVLDIAMGEGRNAVFMASKGYVVEGVDISAEALRKAKKLARTRHVTIQTINADLTNYTLKPESYEVILNIHFLQRNLIPEIKKGLKKGGVVVFENYLEDQLIYQPNLRRDFLLKKGELKEWFKDFDILVYQEFNNGKEAVATLIAKKRK